MTPIEALKYSLSIRTNPENSHDLVACAMAADLLDMGFRLVPVEPTELMKAVGGQAVAGLDARYDHSPFHDNAKHIWTCMVDAAPGHGNAFRQRA